MTIENQPHRVIFTVGKRTRARIFPNLQAATSFAQTVTVVRVHLASENPNIPNQASFHFQTRQERNRCSCGRTKLTSDQHCFDCNGGLDVARRCSRLQKL